MAKQSSSCIKCKSTAYRAREIRTTGSGITRFFKNTAPEYASVACAGCSYTELYLLDGSRIGNILDFFTNWHFPVNSFPTTTFARNSILAEKEFTT